jgi:hypothetical protein
VTTSNFLVGDSVYPPFTRSSYILFVTAVASDGTLTLLCSGIGSLRLAHPDTDTIVKTAA